jgi:acyl carrier protein
MGLDGVELVLRIEETFGISLADEEVSSIQTPRQLTELVLTHLAAAPSAACISQVAFHRLRRSLMSEFSTRRATVGPDVRWESVFPLATRKQSWERLSKALRLRLPSLERPGWLVALIGAVSLVSGLFVLQAVGSGAAVATAITCGIGLTALTTPARVVPPAECRTVGAVARYLAARVPSELVAPEHPQGRPEVRDAVHGIIRDVLGISEVPEDARFVEDLGLS